MKIMIGLTKEQLSFGLSLTDYALDKLRTQLEESKSESDKVLVQGWINLAEDFSRQLGNQSEVVISEINADPEQ
jgi:hypothetical protein